MYSRCHPLVVATGTAAAATDSTGGDDGGRKDQADDAARDRTALGPLLATGIGGFLELDLVIGSVNDHRSVDQVDRACPLGRPEILQGGTRPHLRSIGRNK